MDTIIKGTNPKELSEGFAHHFGTKEHEAYRLLQMENAFIVEQATLKGYSEDGIEKYEILATLDLKTSDICRTQDGEIYDVKKALTGVNSPPFHWFCRTTTIPHIKDNEDGKRVARNPITGKNYTVPAEMKYKQWYNKYVANDPKALVEEKKIKNRYSDKKQHTLYKEVLGKESPKSFAAFQELKYNDINGWENLKKLYSDTRSGKVWLNSTFSTEKRFKKHIEKHLNEFENITEGEYLDIARKLLASPIKDDVEGFTTKLGFVFRYNKATNDFAIGRADGYISTLYRPLDGYKHWLEQINDYKEE